MSKEEVMKEIKKLQEEFPALGVLAEDNLVIEHQDNIKDDSKT